MIYLYDEAIVNKFRTIFDDSRITVQPPENAIRYVAQLSEDDVSFPLISLNRTAWSIRAGDISWAQSRTGIANRVNSDNTISVMRAIPIRLEYQLDIYTVDRLTNDEIYRELIFYFIKHPTLEVDIPYTVDGKHVFNLDINPDITDNSDTVEHVNKGVLYRYTSAWVVKDAYLFEGTDEYNRVARIQLKDKEESCSDVSNN
jgi:hypothetical protein